MMKAKAMKAMTAIDNFFATCGIDKDVVRLGYCRLGNKEGDSSEEFNIGQGSNFKPVLPKSIGLDECEVNDDNWDAWGKMCTVLKAVFNKELSPNYNGTDWQTPRYYFVTRDYRIQSILIYGATASPWTTIVNVAEMANGGAESGADAGPDLSGCSNVVKERFSDSAMIVEDAEDTIYYLDNMEAAMIGTMENESGHTVAVYERGLCIRCLMESYGPNWMDEPSYGYTDEQKADSAFMEAELYTMAVDDFEYNTLRSLPYMHEYAPVIITGFDIDSERWEAMRKA